MKFMDSSGEVKHIHFLGKKTKDFRLALQLALELQGGAFEGIIEQFPESCIETTDGWYHVPFNLILENVNSEEVNRWHLTKAFSLLEEFEIIKAEKRGNTKFMQQVDTWEEII